MSEAGDSTHKRTRSSALSLLQRRNNKETDDTASDDGLQPGNAARLGVSPAPSNSSPMAHRIQPSLGSVSGRVPPYQQSGTSGSLKPSQTPAVTEKGASLEQSVRKFRIVEALRNGDTASITKILRDTGDGARLDDTTVLHLAIQCAELPVVEYVLSDSTAGADVNGKDKDGSTPIHIAASQGRTQIVKLLLARDDINDSLTNNHGQLPLDLARNADIFQALQLSRSLFAETKIKQVQELISRRDHKSLEQVLEEPRLKTILDINSTEFVSDPTTVQAGGTLLHESAKRKDAQLIQVLLLHGADPFRRDRKGKLPQDYTKDDVTRSMLKRSPAAVAAQRGIQEKAVLGHAASQGIVPAAQGETLLGKEAREMKGFLKKWTNYRKGYQLRWFVLEDGVLSYYKHQDDSGSACRGAINMKIAKLHMSADEKTKFEIIGKSSVKYTLKANHEVEAKRWFWALNNAIQWTKDQAKEDDKRRVRNVEMLNKVKAEHTQGGGGGSGSINEAASEYASLAELKPRSSNQLSRMNSHAGRSRGAATSVAASIMDDDEDHGEVGTDVDTRANVSVMPGDIDGGGDDDDDDDDYSSQHDQPGSTKDAFDITAQSVELQLETMGKINTALISEAVRNPALTLSDEQTTQALSTYDAAIRSMSSLLGRLTSISRDRDAYWQYRLEREIDMRRMWEESMAQVAKEQEALQARVGDAEEKKRTANKMLKEAVSTGLIESQQDGGSSFVEVSQHKDEAAAKTAVTSASASAGQDAREAALRSTVLEHVANLSDDDSDDEEEFFDAVDAGEVEAEPMPPSEVEDGSTEVVVTGGLDISSSFKGYENGVRKRLKMDADNRPKISLWGILKSMIGKDMTKMTLPVTFNEPTSLLYRCGEDMEYVQLLDMAADRSDSLERLLYVGAFAASEYASTIDRVAKPFNPLLGETFEYVRPDKNYRFFIEQVSHHPPVGAAWAESPKWTYYGESAVKSKFYGRSFDINPLGTWFLKLRPTAGGKEDFYTWKKVTSSVIGIITGNPAVDNYGLMEVKNWTTGEICYIDFKPRGWKASSAYLVSGKIVDAEGRVRVSIGGRWNSKIYARLTPGFEATVEEPKGNHGGDEEEAIQRGSLADPSKRAFLIWQANPRPKGIPFNLTPFVLTFNHIDDQLRPWIAPTDSRLRPDQRAMEDGDYDFAAEEKNRLEESQRARRKEREAKGEEFSPAWFAKAKCAVTGEEYWRFNGEYWKRRERAGPGSDGSAWKGLEPVYS